LRIDIGRRGNLRRPAMMASNHACTSMEFKQVKLTHAFRADKKGSSRTGFSLSGFNSR
jgi:hypothetical protein